MNTSNILRDQIQAIEQEMFSIYRARVLHEVKLLDAATPTGDEQVDSELRQQADASRKTMLAQDRMLQVREAKMAELQKDLDALTKAE